MTVVAANQVLSFEDVQVRSSVDPAALIESLGECKNCRGPVDQHVDGKCLFDAGAYEPVCAPILEQWMAAQRRKAK